MLSDGAARGARHHRPFPIEQRLAEEAPFAYKDVERAGLARRVAQLVPLGVVKG